MFVRRPVEEAEEEMVGVSVGALLANLGAVVFCRFWGGGALEVDG